MKERILMIRMEYSVLKEKMKENECGWSQLSSVVVGLASLSVGHWLYLCDTYDYDPRPATTARKRSIVIVLAFI
jgi:hypothetical protein